jgi:hypothetical protein
MSLFILLCIFTITLCGIITLVYIIRKSKTESYEKKTEKLKKQMKKMINNNDTNNNNTIVKGKDNINGHVFGLPIMEKSKKLDLSMFNKVLNINYNKKYVEIEGNVRVYQVLNKLVKKNWIIQIPVDMYHLTFSGLIAGVGGGSSSFKYGFIHETILEMDIITSNGEIITCSRDSYAELFYAIPNSMGTLGYITRLKLKIRPAAPYVKVDYKRYTDSKTYFEDLDKYCKNDNIDFIDGTIFNDKDLVLIIGNLVNDYPYDIKLYNKTHIFWKDLLNKTITTQYFKLNDYIWRWDPDMYYTTMETPTWTRNNILRNLAPKNFLRSTTYRKIAKLIKLEHQALDCNDVFIPMEKSNDFFKWYIENYKLYPIYICPVRCKEKFTLWTDCYFCDFGIGYGVNLDIRPDGIDDILEEQMLKYGGRKLLYTSVHNSEEKFWDTLGIDSSIYYKLKDKYDPNKCFPTIYEKVSNNINENK